MSVYVHTDEFLKENSKPTSVQIYLHTMVIKLYTFPLTCSYACRLSKQEGMSKCQHCVTTRCLSLEPLHFDPWRFKNPEQKSPQLSAYKVPENRRLVTLLKYFSILCPVSQEKKQISASISDRKGEVPWRTGTPFRGCCWDIFPRSLCHRQRWPTHCAPHDVSQFPHLLFCPVEQPKPHKIIDTSVLE